MKGKAQKKAGSSSKHSSLWWFLGSAVLLLLMVIVYFGMGLRLFCIRTGSMLPAYPVGSLIAVVPDRSGAYRPDDVITFRLENGFTVTHRVIEATPDGRMMRTKGDNNSVEDSYNISSEQVIGRVVFSVPYAGYPILLMETFFGKTLFVLLLVSAAVMWAVVSVEEKRSEEPEDTI